MDTIFLSAFNWYGALMATGILCGVLGAYFSARRHGMEGDVIITMILICLPLAIIGARVYHVVFDALDPNSTTNWTFVKFCGFSDDGDKFVGLSGLAIYGGLFGAMIGAGFIHLWGKLKKHTVDQRVTFLQLADVGFTFAILGQAIGRWGNYTNLENYGEIITNPTWQWQPFGMYVDGAWRYSMWLYESIWNIVGFGILLYLYLGRHKSFDGFVFAVYGIYYGIGRTWIEAVRVHDVLYIGSIRVSVLVSVLFIIAGVAIIAAHIIRAKLAHKKIFIFVDNKKLNSDYFGYDETHLAHPMPELNKKKKHADEIVVDSSGVAVRVKADEATGASADGTASTETDADATDNERTIQAAAEDPDYEDKWDD